MCLVCDHPHRDQIDDLLRSGAPHSDILNRFPGFGEKTLQRHKKNHLTLKLPNIPSSTEGLPEDLLSHGLQVLLGSIAVLYKLVQDTAHVRGAEALNSSLRTLLEYERTIHERKGNSDPSELTIVIRQAFPGGADEDWDDSDRT